jgi:DNA-binding CsgD family transcriptional regulator
MKGNVTARERQVLELILAGKSTKQLAAELGITFKTAACHRYRLLEKFGAVNTADLISRAVRLGVVNLSPANGPAPVKPDVDGAPVVPAGRAHRDRLSAAIARSALLQEQCRRTREEFAAVREEFLRSCHGFLKTARSCRPGNE